MQDITSTPILILAGGLGTRLSSVISDVPKPMAPINGVPFLEVQIKYFREQGFKNFVLLVCHKAEVVTDHFGDGKSLGVEITYSHEDKPLGTGGAVKKVLEENSFDDFILLNGDSFFDIDLKSFIKQRSSKNAMALKYVGNAARFGTVNIDIDYNVTAFLEKQGKEVEALINSGVYYLNAEIISSFDKEVCSLENDIFPKLVESKQLQGFPVGGKFIDIGIPEDYERSQGYLANVDQVQRKPCLFLDRDGIIVKDTGYLCNKADTQIYDEVVEMIKSAKNKGWHVVVVTNQAGIARGYFTEEEFLAYTKWLNSELLNRGANIDEWFYCPFHEKAGQGNYKRASLLRKPSPGMVLQAMEHFSIDIEKSLMVGDKVSDVLAMPGLKSVIVQGEYSLEELPSHIQSFSSLSELRNYFVE